MAEVRVSFPSLEDVATGAGLPLHKAVENDPAAGKNAHGSLVAKDPTGNLRYLKTNAAGEAIVSFESAETARLKDVGTNAGSASAVTIATIPLQPGLTYQNLGLVVSCFRDAIFDVVSVDDAGGTPVDTIELQGVRVGAGEYTSSIALPGFQFVAGSTGTQELIVRGRNLGTLSTLDVTVSIDEDQT